MGQETQDSGHPGPDGSEEAGAGWELEQRGCWEVGARPLPCRLGAHRMNLRTKGQESIACWWAALPPSPASPPGVDMLMQALERTPQPLSL